MFNQRNTQSTSYKTADGQELRQLSYPNSDDYVNTIIQYEAENKLLEDFLFSIEALTDCDDDNAREGIIDTLMNQFNQLPNDFQEQLRTDEQAGPIVTELLNLYTATKLR